MRLGASRLVSDVRGGAWFYAKLPPTLAIAYTGMLLQGTPLSKALAQWAAILVSLSLLAAWGYVVNDVADMRADARAGRANAAASMTPTRRSLLVSVLALSAVVPFLALGLTLPPLVLLVDYGLAAAYSVPPIRLKERGIVGVIADATAVHALPVLFVVLVTYPDSGLIHRQLTLAVAAVVWSFCYGVRGIVIHQLCDRDNDVRSGTLTFVIRAGADRVRLLTRWLIFPVEVVALLVFVALLYPYAAPFLALLAFYAITDFVKHRVWQVALDPVPATPRVYIVPADLYEVWMSLAFLAALVAQDSSVAVLGLLHVMIFFENIRVRVRDFMSLIAAGTRSLAAR